MKTHGLFKKYVNIRCKFIVYMANQFQHVVQELIRITAAGDDRITSNGDDRITADSEY